jgi:hypothetical protein
MTLQELVSISRHLFTSHQSGARILLCNVLYIRLGKCLCTYQPTTLHSTKTHTVKISIL